MARRSYSPARQWWHRAGDRRALDARGARLVISGRRADQLDEIARGTRRSADCRSSADSDDRRRRDRARAARRCRRRPRRQCRAAGQRPDRRFHARADRPRARRQPARADPAHSRAAPGDGRARAAATSCSCRRWPGKAAPVGSSLYSATKFGLRGFAAGPARGPPRQRRRRDRGLPRLHRRRRHVRGRRRAAAARRRHAHARRRSRPPSCAASSRIAPRSTSRRWACASECWPRSLAPVTVARIQRRLGSAALSHTIAKGQRAKR